MCYIISYILILWKYTNEMGSLPYPVWASTTVRLPERHGLTIGHLVDICTIGWSLNEAVALGDHLNFIHIWVMIELNSVLDV